MGMGLWVKSADMMKVGVAIKTRKIDRLGREACPRSSCMEIRDRVEMHLERGQATLPNLRFSWH
jgi:hypothetical protein